MLKTNADTKQQMQIKKKFGFFDIDSRELGKDGKKLIFQDRTEPIADKLNSLYKLCDKKNFPFVFTTCCSGKFLKRDSFGDILYIPADPSDQAWKKSFGNYRRFYLEKKQYGNPRINSERCAHDFFRYNGNAFELFEKTGIQDWVVFGNGFDICVYTACRRLLKRGFKLIVLADAVAPAYGPGKIGTEENKKKILAELKKTGARIATTKSFFRECANRCGRNMKSR
jgi:nicotinamidase-related amidase